MFILFLFLIHVKKHTMPATRLNGAECRRCVCSTLQPAPPCPPRPPHPAPRCHSHLSVHRSPYLKLCRELPLNCHLRFFAGLARSPVCCIAAAQRFHETGSVFGLGGGGSVCSPALKLKGCYRSLLPLRSFPIRAGGEFKAGFFCFRLLSLNIAEGRWFHWCDAAFASSIYAGLKNNPQFDLQHRLKD